MADLSRILYRTTEGSRSTIHRPESEEVTAIRLSLLAQRQSSQQNAPLLSSTTIDNRTVRPNIPNTNQLKQEVERHIKNARQSYKYKFRSPAQYQMFIKMLTGLGGEARRGKTAEIPFTLRKLTFITWIGDFIEAEKPVDYFYLRTLTKILDLIENDELIYKLLNVVEKENKNRFHGISNFLDLLIKFLTFNTSDKRRLTSLHEIFPFLRGEEINRIKLMTIIKIFAVLPDEQKTQNVFDNLLARNRTSLSNLLNELKSPKTMKQIPSLNEAPAHLPRKLSTPNRQKAAPQKPSSASAKAIDEKTADILACYCALPPPLQTHENFEKLFETDKIHFPRFLLKTLKDTPLTNGFINNLTILLDQPIKFLAIVTRQVYTHEYPEYIHALTGKQLQDFFLFAQENTNESCIYERLRNANCYVLSLYKSVEEEEPMLRECIFSLIFNHNPFTHIIDDTFVNSYINQLIDEFKKLPTAFKTEENFKLLLENVDYTDYRLNYTKPAMLAMLQKILSRSYLGDDFISRSLNFFLNNITLICSIPIDMGAFEQLLHLSEEDQLPFLRLVVKIKKRGPKDCFCPFNWEKLFKIPSDQLARITAYIDLYFDRLRPFPQLDVFKNIPNFIYCLRKLDTREKQDDFFTQASRLVDLLPPQGETSNETRGTPFEVILENNFYYLLDNINELSSKEGETIDQHISQKLSYFNEVKAALNGNEYSAISFIIHHEKKELPFLAQYCEILNRNFFERNLPDLAAQRIEELDYDVTETSAQNLMTNSALIDMVFTNLVSSKGDQENNHNFNGEESALLNFMCFLSSHKFTNHHFEVVEQAGDLLSLLEDDWHRLNLIKTILRLPEHLQMKVVKELSDPTFKDELKRVFEADPNINPAEHLLLFSLSKANIEIDYLRDEWLKILKDPDIEKAGALHIYLEQFIDTQIMGDLDEFTQEFIAAGIRLDNREDNDNPYKIFAQIKEKRAETTTTPPTPKEVIARHSVQLNPIFLEKSLRGKVIKVGVMPKLNLRTRLKSKLDELMANGSWLRSTISRYCYCRNKL